MRHTDLLSSLVSALSSMAKDPAHGRPGSHPCVGESIDKGVLPQQPPSKLATLQCCCERHQTTQALTPQNGKGLRGSTAADSDEGERG